MNPRFDKRILVLGLLVLAVLAFRPVERMKAEPLFTGSIAAVSTPTPR